MPAIGVPVRGSPPVSLLVHQYATAHKGFKIRPISSRIPGFFVTGHRTARGLRTGYPINQLLEIKFRTGGSTMGTQQATQEHEAHIGETKAIANHDHDLVHELSKRLDGVWRYDQYIANAESDSELQSMWRELKQQDQKNVERLKTLIRQEIEKGCF